LTTGHIIQVKVSALWGTITGHIIQVKVSALWGTIYILLILGWLVIASKDLQPSLIDIDLDMVR